MSRHLPLVLSLLVSLGLPLHGARAGQVRDLDAPVADGSEVTFRDLVERVFRAAREDAENDDLLTLSDRVLRRPGSAESTLLPAGSLLHDFEAHRIRGDGRPYLVMFWQAESDETGVPGGGAAILAVFPEGATEPTDVADVKGDRFCSFGEGKPLPLGPDEVFSVTNSHHNSNQGYLDTALFHIHGGRLRLIDSVFTLSLRGMCQNSFEESISWRTRKAPSGPMPDLEVAVTLARGPAPDEVADCPGAKSPRAVRVFREVFRWSGSKGRYLALKRGLGALERFNEKNL